jgi:hypothetical protein
MTPIQKIKNAVSRFPVVVTPVPTLTYTTAYYNPFLNAEWDFSKMAPILYSTVGYAFGSNGNTVVYGIILVTIIGLIWIRQEDAGIPLFMMFILSNIFFWTPGMIPEDWKWFLVALMWLVVTGIGYTIYRGRRD